MLRLKIILKELDRKEKKFMDENQKKGFLLYLNQKEVIDEMTDQEAGIFIKAIFEYEITKKIPKLNKNLKLVFLQFKNALDEDEKHYNETCEKNRKNAKKRWQKKNAIAYERMQTDANINNNNNTNSNTNTNSNSIIFSNIIPIENTSKDVYTRVPLENTPQLFSQIIDYLNDVGTVEPCFAKTKIQFHFKKTKKNQQLIEKILKKGYTKSDIKDVIFLKYDQWIENNDKNKMDMSTFFRPSTLFGEKFDEYLQEAKMKEVS